jgi:hypothetical protein
MLYRSVRWAIVLPWYLEFAKVATYIISVCLPPLIKGTAQKSLKMPFFALLLVLSLAPVSAEAEPGEAILVQGNNRVRGIPGFGENGFAAIYGNYTLGTGGEAAETRIWLCREILLRDSVWTTRNSYDGAWERREGDLLIISLVTGDEGAATGLGPRTAVFAFSGESERILGDGGIDRFIRAWVTRFRYFYNRAEG